MTLPESLPGPERPNLLKNKHEEPGTPQLRRPQDQIHSFVHLLNKYTGSPPVGEAASPSFAGSVTGLGAPGECPAQKLWLEAQEATLVSWIEGVSVLVGWGLCLPRPPLHGTQQPGGPTLCIEGSILDRPKASGSVPLGRVVANSILQHLVGLGDSPASGSRIGSGAD